LAYYDGPDYRPQQRLGDQGTRETHLVELLELWKNAKQIFDDRSEYAYVSEYEKKQYKKLEAGIELLEKQLTTYPGYDFYSIKFYMKEITKPTDQGK